MMEDYLYKHLINVPNWKLIKDSWDERSGELLSLGCGKKLTQNIKKFGHQNYKYEL